MIHKYKTKAKMLTLWIYIKCLILITFLTLLTPSLADADESPTDTAGAPITKIKKNSGFELELGIHYAYHDAPRIIEEKEVTADYQQFNALERCKY